MRNPFLPRASLPGSKIPELSAADPERIHSVVIFYGTGGVDFSSAKASYLGHFAETVPFEPRTNVDQLEESLRGAGRPVTFYRYGGTGLVSGGEPSGLRAIMARGAVTKR